MPIGIEVFVIITVVITLMNRGRPICSQFSLAVIFKNGWFYPNQIQKQISKSYGKIYCKYIYRHCL